MRHNFKDLKIWQKAMDFTDLTYDYCKGLPSDKRFNFVDQINRCSCSIPSNIAEGSGKRSHLQFAEYLTISLTSSYEAETQLLICQRRNYGESKKLTDCLNFITEVQKMIYVFRENILKNEGRPLLILDSYF